MGPRVSQQCLGWGRGKLLVNKRRLVLSLLSPCYDILCCSFTQSSTQNAHYRYPASTACSFSQIAWCAFGEEMVSFAWNKVKKRTFTVDIITTGIVVDFPVPQMPQNWQTKAYFDVFLFRWMKRTISSMKTNYIESTVATKRTLLRSVSTIYKKKQSNFNIVTSTLYLHFNY